MQGDIVEASGHQNGLAACESDFRLIFDADLCGAIDAEYDEERV